MDKCWKCGTYGIFTPLIPLSERVGWMYTPPGYKECKDEVECLRRQRMNMGDAEPDPFRNMFAGAFNEARP